MSHRRKWHTQDTAQRSTQGTQFMSCARASQSNKKKGDRTFICFNLILIGHSWC